MVVIADRWKLYFVTMRSVNMKGDEVTRIMQGPLVESRGRESDARGTQPVQRASDKGCMHNACGVGNCMTNSGMQAFGVQYCDLTI